MKALKIFLVVGLVVAATASFNSVTAQTFNNETQSNISSRQRLIVNLLKQEIQSNKAFAKKAESIQYELNNASENDIIAKDCYKYTPLLVNALNRNELFLDYYNIQGNFGYSFKRIGNNQSETTLYNFIEKHNMDTGLFIETIPSVAIYGENSTQELGGDEAKEYIQNNFCTPLNQILEQNGNLPIPQLLNILSKRFSR